MCTGPEQYPAAVVNTPTSSAATERHCGGSTELASQRAIQRYGVTTARSELMRTATSGADKSGGSCWLSTVSAAPGFGSVPIGLFSWLQTRHNMHKGSRFSSSKPIRLADEKQSLEGVRRNNKFGQMRLTPLAQCHCVFAYLVVDLSA
jgi:hypothetical protein